MYVRNLRKPSANKNVYKFVSSKNGCTVMCESSLEYDCCYYLEYSDDVVSYQSQPKGYSFSYQGKEHPYTPDFLVHKKDGTSYLIEVKPLSKTFQPEFQDKFRQNQFMANELGTSLLLVTDRQIRNEVHLNNLKLVHRYSGCIENSSHLERVWSAVNQSSSICIKVLSEILNLTIGEVFASVLRLIGLGKAKTKLDVLLDENSLISVA
ncbi:Tn7 transposase TnsA N-terminal domain-containing protein [Vibrio alginolyticus]|uniref:TnsA endonuclease N-terminal domain-containing protein n=1 Tax=Vibrio TaxID=662 RepID=UPI001BD20DF3|nr:MULTISPECIES: TnsA endonuclease N-terminal domain-containing protein [Vibrio]ELB2758294.1 Tn7 transposase TnsA N-terminal domain-containing protein [Vibrio alginolyticus]ELB2873961.1 Tn7 transposase TnsA N-terminal domain-containing protein [Vibrio alginolyticus]MBT0098319.1 Tn7 transposase TnsA N-terminal domain-containing protein [Vibrio alginolyticus]MCS0227038.1 TnsA endonuclease N-terminal domain-containing protein [Vibrio alginolyticus]MDY8150400.1 TnsA endonuclease N-terminal domain-